MKYVPFGNPGIAGQGPIPNKVRISKKLVRAIMLTVEGVASIICDRHSDDDGEQGQTRLDSFCELHLLGHRSKVFR